MQKQLQIWHKLESCTNAFPLRGRWHGPSPARAVTDEVGITVTELASYMRQG